MKGRLRRKNVSYAIIFFLAAGVIYLLVIEEIRFFLVPSKSMKPTLIAPEYIVTLSDARYDRGDIVVIEDPLAEGQYLVKRIVALGGDRVGAQGGALFINGHFMSEPYLREPMNYEIRPAYVVKEGEVFVLGDNRNESVDSHNWNQDDPESVEIGGVEAESIIGRVRFVYLPVKRMRRVSSYSLSTFLEEAGNP